MKLIIGLGNPGKKYGKTRHNLGFMAVDFLQKKLEAPEFKLNKKLAAEISKSGKIILAKPQTFMNLSGGAAIKLLSFYKLTADDILIIHDDIDLEFGKIKEGKNHGAAGHNGVKSIIELLGTKDFNRLRIGVGRPPENIPPEDYVLQNFSSEELKQLPKIFNKISI
ncbi:MAG: aminoacyl-tRNA hydrolase [Patescibacteria group bacterium]